jgi:hypothetical protein
MSDRPYTPISPITWTFPDYLGRTLSVTVNFNNSTGRLNGVTTEREPGCLYQTLLWDKGTDGIPDNTTKKRTAPVGTASATRAQLGSIGLDTISDVLAVQFTVGF